jgi:amidase
MAISSFASAGELAALIASGRVSSQQATQHFLDRIQTHNPALHAIVIGNDADALRTARERDDDLAKGIVRGPLHGVPVTVKESFNLAGLRTTVNFPPLRDNVASDDSLVVARLRQAGAAILGKTNIPTMLSDYQSFGPLYPTANNPYDATRTPGGSTGGGAAAVAAGLTTFEFGSDIGGSIRVPSHFCGVFGLKPTENVAMHGKGHVPPAPGGRSGFVAMASVGPLARTMADIDLAWTLVNQTTWKYFQHLPERPRLKNGIGEYRVAWFDDIGNIECGSETRQVIASFVGRLEAAGVACRKQPFESHWLTEAYAIWAQLFGTVLGQDAPWLVRQLLKVQFASWAGRASFNIRGAMLTGLGLGFRNFSRALRRRVELIQALSRRFDEYDFVISPVAAGPAMRHNPKHRSVEHGGRTWLYADYAMPFNVIYNACGNPVLVVPAGRTEEGLPIGVQIAAPHYAERELIHFGTLVEQIGAAKFVAPQGYGD